MEQLASGRHPLSETGPVFTLLALQQQMCFLELVLIPLLVLPLTLAIPALPLGGALASSTFAPTPVP